MKIRKKNFIVNLKKASINLSTQACLGCEKAKYELENFFESIKEKIGGGKVRMARTGNFFGKVQVRLKLDKEKKNN